MIARDTEEARAVLAQTSVRLIRKRRTRLAIQRNRRAGRRRRVKEQLGEINVPDLVQYNDGFKTNLIGTPLQIAERIVALKAVGVGSGVGGVSTFRKKWNISVSECCP